MGNSKQDNNFKKAVSVNTRLWIWITIGFIALITTVCFIKAFSYPITERTESMDKTMVCKLKTVDSIICDKTLEYSIREKALEILDGIDNKRVVYNINGLVWFAGGVVGLLILYVIFAPVKYEWNEMLKNDRHEKAIEKCDNLIIRIDKLAEKLTALESLVQPKKGSSESENDSK